MAIDETQKALNLASKTINATVALLEAYEELQALEDERAASGLDLTDYDADYAASGSLAHVDGARLNAVLNTTIPATVTFWTGAGHDDNLYRIKP